jgi:lysophospholipase L1-like esterase
MVGTLLLPSRLGGRRYIRPCDVRGLRWWLQGDSGRYDATSGGSPVTTDGSAVARWEDLSGNGLHPITFGVAPTYRRSGVNNAPSIRFNGSSQGLGIAHASAGILNTLQDGSYTFVFAVSATALQSIASILGKGDGADTLIFFMLRDTVSGTVPPLSIGRWNAFWSAANLAGGAGVAISTPYIVSYTMARTGANAGTETLRINGRVMARQTSASLPSTNTTRPWSVGCGSSGVSTANYFFPGDIAGLCAYERALPERELKAIEEYWRYYCGMAPFASVEADVRVICEGDSRTIGQGVAAASSYPAQLKALLTSHPALGIQNFGVGGQGVSALAGYRTNRTAFNAIDRRTVYIFWAGINDFFNSVTGATAYTNLKTHITAMHNLASAPKIIVCTELPASTVTGAKETERTNYNSSVVGAVGLDADTVVDLAGDARLQNTADLTYFNADGVHLSIAGYGVVAGLLQSAVAGYLP